MENKNIIIIVVAIIALILIGAGVVMSSGILNKKTTEVPRVTSPLKSDFMEGNFTDNVTLVEETDYTQSYRDEQHDITYNISTIDNTTALMDIYYLQGVMNPEHRTFNGNTWNIYFTQAIQSTTGADNKTVNETVTIVICQCQGEKQGYMINIIVGSDSDINLTAINIYGELYTKYVEPLLKSITLKETDNVTKIYEDYNLTEDQFYEQMEIIKQAKAGNATAIQILQNGSQQQTTEEVQTEE